MSDLFSKMTPEEIKFMVDGYDIEIKKLQAENAELKKQNSELFRLKEVFKARNHKALDYLYSEGCDSAYDARCALEGE